MDVTDGERATNGSNQSSEDDEKVIVRSNGTVTYVGKDIAYQMWKLGLLDRQFGYEKFHAYANGHEVWSTTAATTEGAPHVRRWCARLQRHRRPPSYLQDIVQRGVALLASEDARDRSHHFSLRDGGAHPGDVPRARVPGNPRGREQALLGGLGAKGTRREGGRPARIARRGKHTGRW